MGKQFLELQIHAKDVGKKGERTEGFIWLGETVYPFAQIFASRSTYFVSYHHPKLIRIQGFFTMPETFETTHLDEIIDQIITKARKVEELDEQRQHTALDTLIDPVLRLLIDTARRKA